MLFYSFIIVFRETIGSDYSIYREGNSTCENIGEIQHENTNVVEYGKDECEKSCNENLKCNFYSFDAKNSCKIYQSCKEFKTTEEENFIFVKTTKG